MAGEVPGVMNAKAIVFFNRNTVAFSFLSGIFSPHVYHMEKQYISGMSDSKAALAASIIL